MKLESLAVGLGRRFSEQAVALVTSAEVVVVEEAIEVGLDLLDGVVPGLAAFDANALIERGAVHALDEAVRPW